MSVAGISSSVDAQLAGNVQQAAGASTIAAERAANQITVATGAELAKSIEQAGQPQASGRVNLYA